MELNFIKEIGTNIIKHLTKNRLEYSLVLGGILLGSAISATALTAAFKKLEKKHRKEDAEKYKADFKQRIKELDKKYQHNEYLLKQKINELCDEFGIEHVC